MNKKICVILMVFVLSLSFVGCNNSVDQNDNDIVNYVITKEADYKATTPEDLFEIADVVVEGKFGDNSNTYVGENSLPITKKVFNIENVYKGNVDNQQITVDYYGGTVSMYAYLDSLTEEQILKRGLDCSIAEAARMTVSYAQTDETVLVTSNDSYVLFLSYDLKTNTYFILCDAYGACRVLDDSIYSLVEKQFVDVDFK